ncbi:MAG TPA: NIPSNAP family protein [Ilumatobacteraceae bacterium]|nr:NIPSNAP family protein [Ilumatobacteraceae bacterium]
MVGCCPVVELRQYTLHTGQRDVLVELFDREFVESQEAVGMEVIGQFRDLDRPDRFVWLRGFPDMELRRMALEAFYGGPVWKLHRQAANATMIDVDDVLLLRPLPPTTGFGPQPERPAPGAQVPASLMVVTICSLRAPADVAGVEGELLPALTSTGAPPLAMFIEEPSENTFPALPVRTGEHVVVWIQRVRSTDTTDGGSADALIRSAGDLARDLLPDLVAAPVQLRLEPTPRSRLR